MYEYNATVHRVVDGDTFDAIVDVGFSIHVKHRFRLADIDTPETWRPKTDAEREHGEKATELVMTLILGKQVKLLTYKLGIYGRYSASVVLPDGRDLASILKEAGFEKRFDYAS